MKSEFEKSLVNLLIPLDEETEYIPLLSEDEEENLKKMNIPDVLPILPLRNTVLFPGVVIPITVGRNKSLKLIQEVNRKNKILGAVAQRDASVDDPVFDDLYRIGTVAQILKILDMPDGSTSVIIQGRKRFEMESFLTVKPYHVARIKSLDDSRDEPVEEAKAVAAALKELGIRIIKLSSNIPTEATFAVKNIESPSFLINFLASNSEMNLKQKQELLEISSVAKRGIYLLEHLTEEVKMLELKNDIQTKVKIDLDQQQREFLLHQQMKTIQDELGGSPQDQEMNEFKKRAAKKKWNKEIKEAFHKELDKLQRLNPATGEYSVQVNYIQTLLELPWNEYTRDNFNLKRAGRILEKDHFGLEKVKERILEHLAVLKLKGDMKSPILCLVGPPGVGKTSLGKSIADALDRRYIRMSLGGLHDEAEIRGHRKTYIGAMPGRIIQNLKKARSSNPVFVLDEIDKVGRDIHGDPASALLEVLDPEQNINFHDNFLELDYDLSRVMFIATANTTSGIHPALLDRMEIIELSGYIVEEKVEIARAHLIPKQLSNHGLKKGQVSLPRKTLEYMVDSYTRESGVRQLDKQISKILRSIAKYIALEEPYSKILSLSNVKDILGPPRYLKEKYLGNEFAGVVTGLAWTATGGEILFVETSLSKGDGKLTLTGNLGDVMKESAVIALEYLKSHSSTLNLDPSVFQNWNVHIHVPEGAIPKDGPSAGVTMVTSVASAFTQRKVKNNLAMTGEITLRGKILPVGGIKEKILAAKRAGINQIAISSENFKDVKEINEIYTRGLTFKYMENVGDLLKFALLKEKVKNPLSLN
ncbi:MAG TPA: endopeptidase La [Bacteroidaceae bacterium]|nr:endopeptidase La [Bacteroidaceae bacterium]